MVYLSYFLSICNLAQHNHEHNVRKFIIGTCIGNVKSLVSQDLISHRGPLLGVSIMSMLGITFYELLIRRIHNFYRKPEYFKRHLPCKTFTLSVKSSCHPQYKHSVSNLVVTPSTNIVSNLVVTPSTK